MDGSEYIKEQSLEFCRKQNLKEAMLKSVDLLQSNSFDEISKIINESLKLGSESNFGHDFLVDFEERYKPRFRGPVTAGWKQVDDMTGGPSIIVFKVIIFFLLLYDSAPCCNT